MDDVKATVQKYHSATDDSEDPLSQPFLLAFEQNVDSSLQTYDRIRDLLQNFDQALISKLKMHENDFLDAYQLHMVKIEKELQLLKAKAAEQDNKLH